MMKVLRCCEVGENCDFVARGKTEEEVLKKAIDHAKTDHDIKKVTLEFIRSWHDIIRDEK